MSLPISLCMTIIMCLTSVPGRHKLALALGLAGQPPPVDAGGDHGVPEPEYGQAELICCKTYH